MNTASHYYMVVRDWQLVDAETTSHRYRVEPRSMRWRFGGGVGGHGGGELAGIMVMVTVMAEELLTGDGGGIVEVIL